MTALAWDTLEDRRYETGIDRCVISRVNGSRLQVWNGVVSVQEAPDGGEVQSYYYDGVKYLHTVNNKDYMATIQAFTTPDDFVEYEGQAYVTDGFILTAQPRRLFNFSYRTLKETGGYKLHLVYNVAATPKTKSYRTRTDTISPSVFEWELNATPAPCRPSSGKPSAHLIIDSTIVSPDQLLTLENYLYGTSNYEFQTADGGTSESSDVPNINDILELDGGDSSSNVTPPFLGQVDGGSPASPMSYWFSDDPFNNQTDVSGEFPSQCIVKSIFCSPNGG